MREPALGPEALENARLIDRLIAEARPEAAPQDQGLALVAREGGFGDRYRVWRGRSGARYLVTVMPLGEARRVVDAVTLIVAIASDGRRRVVWAGGSDAEMPGLRIEPDETIEAHVHLIAADPETRRDAVEDLVSGTQAYSSVLTPS